MNEDQNKIDNITKYLSSLQNNQDQYIFLIAVCDEGSKKYSKHSFSFLSKYLPDELSFRTGFAAIIDCTKSFFESKIGNNISVEYTLDDTKYVSRSSGFIDSQYNPGYAYFLINSQKFELFNNRGINICIYSKTKSTVVDLLSVDTFYDESGKIHRFSKK